MIDRVGIVGANLLWEYALGDEGFMSSRRSEERNTVPSISNTATDFNFEARSTKFEIMS